MELPELEAYPGELAKIRAELEMYKKGYDAAMRIIKSTYADRYPDTYFISGEGGRKDENNLPERIYVTPAYGVDWFQIYERSNRTHGPEW